MHTRRSATAINELFKNEYRNCDSATQQKKHTRERYNFVASCVELFKAACCLITRCASQPKCGEYSSFCAAFIRLHREIKLYVIQLGVDLWSGMKTTDEGAGLFCIDGAVAPRILASRQRVALDV